jgi:hypothetical protein
MCETRRSSGDAEVEADKTCSQPPGIKFRDIGLRQLSERQSDGTMDFYPELDFVHNASSRRPHFDLNRR